EREHLLHHGQRHASSRGLAPSPVEQLVVAFFLVAFPPAPHVPVADAQNLRRLPPPNLLRHRLQHHVLYFHRPLHRGLRVTIHASHGLLPSPPAKRTYHLLSQPDISCATDNANFSSCQKLKVMASSNIPERKDAQICRLTRTNRLAG